MSGATERENELRAALNRLGEYVDRIHILLPTALHKAEAMQECALAADVIHRAGGADE